MLTTFFTIIGLILLTLFVYKILVLITETGTTAVLAILSLFLLSILFPFAYLSKYRWLWFLQAPLILFYGLFFFLEGWGAIPYALTINCLIFLLVHNITRLGKRSKS